MSYGVLTPAHVDDLVWDYGDGVGWGAEVVAEGTFRCEGTVHRGHLVVWWALGSPYQRSVQNVAETFRDYLPRLGVREVDFSYNTAADGFAVVTNERDGRKAEAVKEMLLLIADRPEEFAQRKRDERLREAVEREIH